MNKIYKRVFSRALGEYVVASENAKGKSKSKSQTTGAVVAKTLSSVIFAASALFTSLQAQAEFYYQEGYEAMQGSYLPNVESPSSYYYYGTQLKNLNLWENLDAGKSGADTINVSDFNYAHYWYENYLAGDRVVALGNSTYYDSNSAQLYNHGSNNTVLLAGSDRKTIHGNNNTVIGSQSNNNNYFSSYINSQLNKGIKYDSLSAEDFDAMQNGKLDDLANNLIANGATEDDLYKLNFWNYEGDDGNYYWYADNQFLNDYVNADLVFSNNVGHRNTVLGDSSIFQGNDNAMIGDNQFSGGNNNILTGTGASVINGNNNVVTSAYTSLGNGNNNVLIMSKDVEASKYLYTYNNEPIGTRFSTLTKSAGIDQEVQDIWEGDPKYTGSFDQDYEYLKQRYLVDYNNSAYSYGYFQGAYFDYFNEQRNKLFAHYGYAIGDSDNSILIGSTGSFSAINGIALGQNATVIGNNSIALGANSVALEDNVIAAGGRKLTGIQDGAADTDLINVRQATAWAHKMKDDLNPHFTFVDRINDVEDLYPTVRDITPEEVVTIIKQDLDAGTEGVRKDLIETKLVNEVARAENEILAALVIKKNEEVADAKIDITLDIGKQGSITSDLNEAILGFGTAEKIAEDRIKEVADDLVREGNDKLNILAENELQGTSNVIADTFQSAEGQLSLIAQNGFDIWPSKNAADVDDDLHTEEMNNLISATITGKNSDGSTVITDSLSKAEQEELAQQVKDNSDDMNEVVVQNFEQYQQNALGKYTDDLGNKLNKGINDAIGNIDNLAKAEDQVMLKEVGSKADDADKAWAKQALDTTKTQIEDVSKDILDYATQLDQQLVIDATNHVDAADQEMLEQGIKDLSAKDNAVKEELEQAIKDGDQLVAETAKDLANELDTDLQEDLFNLTNTTHESLLSGLKVTADKGDQVLFERFDEFLKSAESADENRILAEVKAGDEDTYRQLVEYADRGDAETLAQAQGYIDQKYGELNDAMQKSEDTLNASIASSLATASVPTSNRAGKALIGFGTGHYGGQSAFALGASAMTNSKKFSFGVTASLDTQHENSGSFSVGYYW